LGNCEQRLKRHKESTELAENWRKKNPNNADRLKGNANASKTRKTAIRVSREPRSEKHNTSPSQKNQTEPESNTGLTWWGEELRNRIAEGGGEKCPRKWQRTGASSYNKKQKKPGWTKPKLTLYPSDLSRVACAHRVKSKKKKSGLTKQEILSKVQVRVTPPEWLGKWGLGLWRCLA